MTCHALEQKRAGPAPSCGPREVRATCVSRSHTPTPLQAPFMRRESWETSILGPSLQRRAPRVWCQGVVLAPSRGSVISRWGNEPRNKHGVKRTHRDGRHCTGPRTRGGDAQRGVCVRCLRKQPATREVITFCFCGEQDVGSRFSGTPDGVGSRECGRHPTQRIAFWQEGKASDSLTHTSQHVPILSFHWLPTRNIKPVSCRWSETHAQRESVAVQDVWFHWPS